MFRILEGNDKPIEIGAWVSGTCISETQACISTSKSDLQCVKQRTVEPTKLSKNLQHFSSELSAKILNVCIKLHYSVPQI